MFKLNVWPSNINTHCHITHHIIIFANNQDSASFFPYQGFVGSGDYFRTMALCQILTRYHPTSRITSCVREIRESAGNAFWEPFSEVSGHCGWGTAFAIRFLPSPPNLRVTFREVAFPHDCRFLFTTITSFCNRESNRERVRMSGRSFSPRRQTSSRAYSR